MADLASGKVDNYLERQIIGFYTVASIILLLKYTEEALAGEKPDEKLYENTGARAIIVPTHIIF